MATSPGNRSWPTQRPGSRASCARRQPGLPLGAFKLLGGSPKAKVTPVGCAVGPAITGQLTLEGIPVLGLVDTGASVTCLGFSIWWRYRARWGPLRQFEGTVHCAHGKPLQITGKTQHLDLQWGEARGRACFIVIVGLESPPCLIGMDIMRPLRVHIDVTNGTATPAQPDPQTVHLNAAQSQQQRRKMPLPGTDLTAVGAACPPQKQRQRREMPLPEVGMLAPPVAETSPTATPATTLPGEPLSTASLSAASPSAAAPLPPLPPPATSRALLLQPADIPPETARLVRCHNPWPAKDVLYCSNEALPAFETGIPALSSGAELWIAIHNYRTEPLQLHSGQNIGILKVVTLADAPPTASQPGPPRRPPLPECKGVKCHRRTEQIQQVSDQVK